MWQSVTNENLLNWKLKIKGPKESPYEDGTF